jgi:hypothetical protein
MTVAKICAGLVAITVRLTVFKTVTMQPGLKRMGWPALARGHMDACDLHLGARAQVKGA